MRRGRAGLAASPAPGRVHFQTACGARSHRRGAALQAHERAAATAAQGAAARAGRRARRARARQQSQDATDEKLMPRQESAMGKWKPSVDIRCLFSMMSPEDTAIQATQAATAAACARRPPLGAAARRPPPRRAARARLRGVGRARRGRRAMPRGWAPFASVAHCLATELCRAALVLGSLQAQHEAGARCQSGGFRSALL